MVLNLKLLISTSLLVSQLKAVSTILFSRCVQGTAGSKCTYGYVCVALRWIIGQRFYVWEKLVVRINDFFDFEQVALKFQRS